LAPNKQTPKAKGKATELKYSTKTAGWN